MDIFWLTFIIYITAKHFYNVGFNAAIKEMQEAGILLPINKEGDRSEKP